MLLWQNILFCFYFDNSVVYGFAMHVFSYMTNFTVILWTFFLKDEDKRFDFVKKNVLKSKILQRLQ